MFLYLVCQACLLSLQLFFSVWHASISYFHHILMLTFSFLFFFFFSCQIFCQTFCFSYGCVCSRLPPSVCVSYLKHSSSAGISTSLDGNLFSSSKRCLQLDVDSFCLPLRQFSLGSLGSLSAAFVEIKRQTTMLITSNMACM